MQEKNVWQFSYSLRTNYRTKIGNVSFLTSKYKCCLPIFFSYLWLVVLPIAAFSFGPRHAAILQNKNHSSVCSGGRGVVNLYAWVCEIVWAQVSLVIHVCYEFPFGIKCFPGQSWIFLFRALLWFLCLFLCFHLMSLCFSLRHQISFPQPGSCSPDLPRPFSPVLFSSVVHHIPISLSPFYPAVLS